LPKAPNQQNVNIITLFVQLAEASIQQIFGGLNCSKYTQY